MNINVMVNYTGEEVPTMNSSDAAAAVLAALHGDPEKDICSVQMSQSGSSGAIMPPPTGTAQPAPPAE